ncbi:MAG: DUF4384 domain-containing protein [Rhizobiales bacterium]|nr:DUF4384 domain-containing protein [Hyphomicrobiales bacterium]
MKFLRSQVGTAGRWAVLLGYFCASGATLLAAQDEISRITVKFGATAGDTTETLKKKAAVRPAPAKAATILPTEEAVKPQEVETPSLKDVAAKVPAVEAEAETIAAPDPIEGLIPVQKFLAAPKPCGRELINLGAVAEAIKADLSAMPRAKADGTRYLTFANLYNACVSEADLAAHKNAAVKLLNSLTWSTNTVSPALIGPQKLIMRFHQNDLGWSDKTWGKILLSYPYAVQTDVPRHKVIWNTSRSIMPYVRADWFAFAASRPPLYYNLLGLPKSVAALRKKLGMGPQKDAKVARSGFQLYGVQSASRVLERHAREGGAYWQTYEFAGLEKRSNLFDYPLGPGGENRFGSIGGTIQFSLPNGLRAWFIHNRSGGRINGVPLKKYSGPDDWRLSNGFYCAACNFAPLQFVPDRIRAHVDGNDAFSPELQDQVRKLYPRRDYMEFLRGRDEQSYAEAYERAGLISAGGVGKGAEPIKALADLYQARVVDLQTAAADVGVTPEVFNQTLADKGTKSFNTGRLIAQRGLPRIAFEAKYAAIVQIATDYRPLRAKSVGRLIGFRSGVPRLPSKPAPKTGAFKLSLVSNKSRYKRGDQASFAIQTFNECTLTVILANRDGSGTVVFPNKFRAHPTINGDKEVLVPSGSAPFQLTLENAGEETVVALCDGSNRRTGIRHNFQKEAFTKIKNVRALLESWISKSSKKRKKRLAYTALRLPVEP